MKKTILAMLLGSILLASGGCVVYGRPARPAVVVGVAPFPGAIWVPGYYYYDGYHRHWRGGYWRR